MSRVHEALQNQQLALDEEDFAQGDGSPAAAVQERPPVTAAVSRLASSCREVRFRSGAAALPFEDGDRNAAEQYRLIRTRILQHERKPRVIAVSSPGSGDGKTISSVNIAGALSLTKRTILIDGDFRRSRVHTTLGLEPCEGLAEVLSGRTNVEDVIVRSEQFPGFFLMLAGLETQNAAELLDSPKWRSLCELLRGEFDYVIVDTPPIGAIADYELIQKEMDGIIFIVRPDHSRKAACVEALEVVPREKLIGAVINCSRRWLFWRTHYGYYSDDYRNPASR